MRWVNVSVCICVYISLSVCLCMTEGGEKAAVHLIDSRCKSLGKGVKGHCCHDNNVWLNAKGLGAGPARGLENQGGFRGHYCSFFRQRDHFPFPPLSSWWMLMWLAPVMWRYRPWHQPQMATATKRHWPLGSRPAQTSSVATMTAGGPWWHRPSAARPLPICLTPPHAWPFHWGGCQFLVTRHGGCF